MYIINPRWHIFTNIVMALSCVKVVTLDEIKSHTLFDLFRQHEYLAVDARALTHEILERRARYDCPVDEILMLQIEESCGGDLKFVGPGYEWVLKISNRMGWDRVAMYPVECVGENYVVIWRIDITPMSWVQRHKEINLIIENFIVAEVAGKYSELICAKNARRQVSWLQYIFGSYRNGYAF